MSRPAACSAQSSLRIDTLGGGFFRLVRDPDGAIVVRAAPAGLVVIDAQDAKDAEELVRTLATLGGGAPPQIVINSHYHADHIGGNARLHAAGARTIAHANVVAQASKDTTIAELRWTRSAAAPEALPRILLRRDTAFTFAGEPVEIIHRPRAHTDGDLVVRFPRANILFLGDILELGAYPFVDIWAGGSIDGMIETITWALAGSDGQTRFVPGHGPVADRATVEDYLRLLEHTRAAAAAALRAGGTADSFSASRPTAAWDARFGGERQGARFARIVFWSVQRRGIGS